MKNLIAAFLAIASLLGVLYIAISYMAIGKIDLVGYMLSQLMLAFRF